jgi:ABC-type transport system involved in cytochrome bd biosynthesis fused ATPase/permease subunit
MSDYETFQKVAAGAAGSGLAAWMAKVVGLDLIISFLGGLAVSWFLSDTVAEYFNAANRQAAIGFVVGFLAMLVLRKLYESVQSIEAAAVARAIVDKLRQKLGV